MVDTSGHRCDAQNHAVKHAFNIAGLLCQKSALKDKANTPQVVLILYLKPDSNVVLPRSDSNSCTGEISCSSDFWGHYHDLAWQLCSYVTLNLVKVERGGKREEWNISLKWTTIHLVFFHPPTYIILDFLVLFHRGLTVCHTSKPPVCVHVSTGWVTIRPEQRARTRAPLYKLLSITTKLPKKHPQRKVVSSISPKKLTTLRKNWRLGVKCSPPFIMRSHEKRH